MALKHSAKRTVKRFLTILTIVLTLLTTLISVVFVNRVTLPYNSEGKSFDENSLIVYNEQAIAVYGILLLSVLLLTLFVFFKTRKAFYK